MTQQFDLIVIGSGTAATVAALRAREAGWGVAIVDFRRFGGTCALRGCDPKKVLVAAATALDRVKRMQGKGIAGDAHIEWQELMAFKRTFTDQVPEKKERLYAEKGIVAFHGCAQFTGARTLDVDGQSIEARHILIASGAEAAPLGIPGEQYLVTNELFLTMDVLPRRIVIVGGGYIAAELANVVARAGANVTIVGRGERMLSQFEPELVGWLMKAFDAAGITVCTGMDVESIEKCGAAYQVAASGHGKQISLDADLVVHAAGRRPALASLKLEAAGIDVEKGRLKLNEYLQSVSNPAVYGAGDAAQSGPPLTPVASHDARVAAANILEGNHQQPDYRGVPSVAFTIPPIASVGLSEAAAKEANIQYRATCQNAGDWFSARHSGQSVYGFKVLTDVDTDCVLGAHLVGPHVEELINLFAVAIRHNIRAADLKATVFAYPTDASDVASML